MGSVCGCHWRHLRHSIYDISTLGVLKMNNPEQKSNWVGELFELVIDLIVGCFSIIGSIFSGIFHVIGIIFEGILELLCAIFE